MRFGAGVAVLLVLIGLAGTVAVSLFRQGEETVAVPLTTATSTPASIYVHVLGAVDAPGLYRLPAGARVMDAITAAGGFRDDADDSAINLARYVTDGEQLRVPAEGEQEAQDADDGLVDLNAADAEELETLPRIGPALAARIIAWRDENGGFRSVDDLRNVSGIGEKTFEGLKDLVRV